MLDRREHQEQLAATAGLERRGRLIPPRIDHLGAIDLGLCSFGQRPQVEPGVEAGLDLGGGYPSREGDELIRRHTVDSGLLAELPDRRRPECILALSLAAVHCSPGKHPGPSHEACLWIALDEQQLERVAPTAQDDHGGSRAGDRLLA